MDPTYDRSPEPITVTRFTVQVKSSAVEVNREVRALLDERGPILEFDSRTDAEALANRLTDGGDRVRIQSAAPQDPTDADAYLISDPPRSTREPKDSPKRGLTFDTDANQYGALGEALVVGSPGVSPAIEHYLVETAGDVDPGVQRLRGIGHPDLPDAVDASVSWNPDYLVEVRDRSDGQLREQYCCEIKAGNASFQRGQREAMRRVAETVPVLKVRVDLDGLPDEYTVRIARVDPDEE